MGFERTWTAEILERAPLIAPARQYVWPLQIAGEEDALARGAMQLLVKPATGGSYLATCALGFRDPAMPNGVWGCPSAEEICAVAGGYAYIAMADTPERCVQVGMRPVTAVIEAVEARLLLFVGFQTIMAWGVDGQAWETVRLSWDGVRVTGFDGQQCWGMGWDLVADAEVEFRVELGTGKAKGGGYQVSKTGNRD